MRNFILIVFRWSECSRSCGGGIRSSKRNCTNPTPQGGGLYCIGSRVRYESCNTWECPRGSQDPRLQQCQKFNGNNFKISGIPSDVQWVPKYTSSMQMFLYSSKSDVLYNFVPILKFWIPIFSSQVRGSDRCKLFCRVQDSSTYYLLGASVVDGTQCGADTFDACVAGQCVAAGCDHVLGSGMKLGK